MRVESCSDDIYHSLLWVLILHCSPWDRPRERISRHLRRRTTMTHDCSSRPVGRRRMFVYLSKHHYTVELRRRHAALCLCMAGYERDTMMQWVRGTVGLRGRAHCIVNVYTNVAAIVLTVKRLSFVCAVSLKRNWQKLILNIVLKHLIE